MTSRRKLILQSLVDQLGTICTTAGYNTNVCTGEGGGGAQKVSTTSNSYALLPTVIVSLFRETKIEARHTYFVAKAEFELACFCKDDGATPLEDQVEDLVEDVEKLLLTLKAGEPPFGLVGVDDIEVDGHEKFAVDGESVAGAVVTGTVQYRHDLTSTAQYTGTS